MSTVTAVPIAPVKRVYLVWLWLGIAAAVIGAAALAWASPSAKTTPSGLRYQVLAPGTGSPPTDADVALVTYEGRLPDGKVFDHSEQPFVAPLGVGATVPGFEEALKLMPRGARYRVWMKPSLAYKDKDQRDGSGKVVIPANSTLVFDLTMLDYKSKADIQRMQQMQMLRQGQGQGQGIPGMPPAGQ